MRECKTIPPRMKFAVCMEQNHHPAILSHGVVALREPTSFNSLCRSSSAAPNVAEQT